MKIFNIKINLSKIIWISFFVIMLALIIYYILHSTTIHMNNQNFTSILRDSHQNISKYLGRKVTMSGYVFRGKDFESTQFVVARDMLINEVQANIVGFLCTYDFANDFEDNVWVEVCGTITLGDYNGPIPVIKIDTIKRITTPEDIFVFPPTPHQTNL